MKRKKLIPTDIDEFKCFNGSRTSDKEVLRLIQDLKEDAKIQKLVRL